MHLPHVPPGLSLFSVILPIWKDFSRIFDKSKLLGVRLLPCTTAVYTTGRNVFFELKRSPDQPRQEANIASASRQLQSSKSLQRYYAMCGCVCFNTHRG